MADKSADRRHFLSLCTAGLGAALTALIAVPAATFVASPAWRRTLGGDTDYVPAGPIDKLPSDKWALVPIQIERNDGWVKTVQARSVWVRRTGSGSSKEDLKVLSPICPHLGCPIAPSPDGAQFRCPCHGAEYDQDGNRIAGPPPRGMDPLQHDVREGQLWVRWQDFKIGVPDRVPVSV